MTYNIEQLLCSLTALWFKRIYQTLHSKEKERFSYQSGIKLRPCYNVFCSSCLKRQTQSGFVHTTDLADLQSLHKKTQYNWLSKKCCKHSSWWHLHVQPTPCYPSRLFPNRPIMFLRSRLAVWFSPFIAEINNFKKPWTCECHFYYYCNTLGSENVCRTLKKKKHFKSKWHW